MAGKTTAAGAAKKEDGPSNVHEAILQVMKKVPYVQKTGKVKGAVSYSFASEADLIAALHDAMVEANLVMVPTAARADHHDQFPTERGKILSRIVLEVTYTLTHVPSQTSTPVVVFGEAGDVGDKSTPKAMTIAYKYALRQAFNIETGNDPDRSVVHEENEIQPQKSAPAQQPVNGKPPAADAAACGKALAAIKKLSGPNDLEVLEKYREHYLQRGFSKDNLAKMDAAYEDKKKELRAMTAGAADGGEDEEAIGF